MFQDWDTTVKGCLQAGVATISCLPAVFVNVLNALLVFVGLTTLVLFIVGGYRFLNSAGDPKKLETARKTLLYAILGGAIVLFSFAIIKVISTVTGVECIETFGFGCNP